MKILWKLQLHENNFDGNLAQSVPQNIHNDHFVMKANMHLNMTIASFLQVQRY